MKLFDMVQIGAGAVGFAGLVRGSDEQGHDLFQVVYNGVPLYGEYKRRFAKNNNDFDIDIVSFGYFDFRNVGDINNITKKAFSAQESEFYSSMIKALFCDPIAAHLRSELRIFSRESFKFLGDVRFLSGWVRVS
jgi:hypothetical protein